MSPLFPKTDGMHHQVASPLKLPANDAFALTISEDLSSIYDFRNSQLLDFRKMSALKVESPMCDGKCTIAGALASSSSSCSSSSSSLASLKRLIPVTPLATAKNNIKNVSSDVSIMDALKNHVDATVPSRKWSIGRLLGEGGCGQVFRAMFIDSGQLLAVKRVTVHLGTSFVSTNLCSIDREISALRVLEHPHIVRYFGVDTDLSKEDSVIVWILMELVAGGSICSLLREMGPFAEPVVQNYTFQILLGLEYLHANDILHRDIKGGNILIDRSGQVKLSDFGASKSIADLILKAEGSTLKGTVKWMAPEVCSGKGGSKASDIWSVACTVVELSTGSNPFPEHTNNLAALFQIGMGNCIPVIPSHLSAAARDFLRLCFSLDPAQRPSASQLFKHEWFTGFVKSEASIKCNAKFPDMQPPSSFNKSPLLRPVRRPSNEESLSSPLKLTAVDQQPVLKVMQSSPAPQVKSYALELGELCHF